MYTMSIPAHLPTHRFYYHYKHALGDPIQHYAYEVIGIGLHTEDDTRVRELPTVVRYCKGIPSLTHPWSTLYGY
jgi:hypothetical protein